MIMTKEKEQAFSKLATKTMPGNGTYTLTTSFDAHGIINSDADFVVMGMIVPAAKAASLAEHVSDATGLLHSPMLLLKKNGDNRGKNPELRTSDLKSDSGADISIKEIEIIPGRHEVKVNGTHVTLTFSEFRILQMLAANPGWVFSREQIISTIHGNEYSCTERAVDVQVTGLRKKLGDAGRYIETVRGVGYRFKA